MNTISTNSRADVSESIFGCPVLTVGLGLGQQRQRVASPAGQKFCIGIRQLNLAIYVLLYRENRCCHFCNNYIFTLVYFSLDNLHKTSYIGNSRPAARYNQYNFVIKKLLRMSSTNTAIKIIFVTCSYYCQWEQRLSTGRDKDLKI